MIISIFAASAILAVAASAHHRPNVTYIGNSSIEGLTQYLGIPYARPPVGYLRFAPPKHLPSHPRKTVNATAYGPGCPQLSDYALYNGISEDCLTLNIVVPTGRNASSPPLPVMFWVHGGGNVNGQSIFYNGTELVKQSVECGKPVIYVGINYRLGGFGFLTNPMFNDAGLSNLGLMDQHLALDWVHKHIAGLGGDPKKVTIFGESAGAANCWAQAHYASTHNETGKYFRAIITQSGAPGSPAFPTTLLPEEGVAGFEDLLESANCTGSNDTIACLRTAPYDAIAPVLTNLSSTSYTLDGAWFKDDLATLLRSGSFAHLPTVSTPTEY
jgi:acetylcholinesterase